MIYDIHTILNFLESDYKAIFILMAVFSALTLYFGKIICDVMPQISEKQDWYFVGALFIVLFMYLPFLIIASYRKLLIIIIVIIVLQLLFSEKSFNYFLNNKPLILDDFLVIIENIKKDWNNRTKPFLIFLLCLFILDFFIFWLYRYHFSLIPVLVPLFFYLSSHLAIKYGEIMRNKVTIKVYLKDGGDHVLEGELIKHLKDAIHIRIKKKDKDGKEVYENHFILKENIKEIVWCDETQFSKLIFLLLLMIILFLLILLLIVALILEFLKKYFTILKNLKYIGEIITKNQPK